MIGRLIEKYMKGTEGQEFTAYIGLIPYKIEIGTKEERKSQNQEGQESLPIAGIPLVVPQGRPSLSDILGL